MNIISRQQHPYHQVDASPWPIIMSMVLQGGALSLVSFQTHKEVTQIPTLIGITQVAILWWRDVIREAKGGYHTQMVQKGIQIGFLLFQITEVMQFASFFWAFFHASLAPAVDQGSTWPPVGINAVNTWAIPQQGSCVQQGSGFIQTQGHHAIIGGQKDQAQITLFFTIILGMLFVFLQYNEYYYGEFTIADSVFGSVFYCTTGLHAIHVIVGVIFQTVGFIRQYFDDFTTEHHIGMEFAIFYWHLVDVVWLLVFVQYYYWGS